ncbi:AraC family transcriptional regulator [Melioribacteraceae bacterium 4301-Me]|uniref:AraC family transcriptional regulator n=1 Tax=Pyranulibacter aquaticus TaxID=3163344 RepID=UPI003595D9D9
MCTDGFNGKIENYWKFQSFAISETVYSPNAVLEPHIHTFPILSVIVEGELTEQIENKEIRLSYSSLIYKPAGEMHSNKFHKEGARCLNIQLSQDWLEKLQSTGLDYTKVLSSSKQSNTSTLARLKNELKINDTYSEKIIEGLIIELFADLTRPNNLADEKHNPPLWLKTIINYMDANPEDKLSIGNLAEMVGVHPVHFINTFRKHYNMTPAEYLRQKKIELICKDLSTTNNSLLDIIFKYNFSDQSHFIKFFKKYLGITPSQYISIQKNYNRN